MSEHVFEAGETIFRAGEGSDICYVIKSGAATLELTHGEVVIQVHLGVGDFIGDAAAIFTNPGSADTAGEYGSVAVAADRVTVMEVPLALLKAEIDGASPFLRGWIGSFADRALKVIEAAVAQAKG